MTIISIDPPVKKLIKSWLFHNELRPDRQTRAPRKTVDFLSRIFRPYTLLIDPCGSCSIGESVAMSLVYEEDFSIREKCSLLRLSRLLNRLLNRKRKLI